VGQALSELIDQSIDVRGARLRVRTAGEGPAVLLVHGWALDLDMWTPQFAALADSNRLIAFDRRGFGRSSGTPGVDHDLADIEQLLATLRVERIAIVGMSQGARVALRWALYAPRATTCLVLDGPPRDLLAARPSEGEIALTAYRELVRNEGIDAFRKQWLKHPLMRLYTAEPSAQALLREMVGRYPGHDLMGDETAQLPGIGNLQRLDLPVLIVNGEHDTETRIDAGAELARALPHAQLAIIPGAGHLSNLDNPDAYNREIHRFLASSQRSTCRAE
jgi:pimeloyl-ACP methyl ester carboxylesterase